jgi:hypothetical protein
LQVCLDLLARAQQALIIWCLRNFNAGPGGNQDRCVILRVQADNGIVQDFVPHASLELGRLRGGEVLSFLPLTARVRLRPWPAGGGGESDVVRARQRPHARLAVRVIHEQTAPRHFWDSPTVVTPGRVLRLIFEIKLAAGVRGLHAC